MKPTKDKLHAAKHPTRTSPGSKSYAHLRAAGPKRRPEGEVGAKRRRPTEPREADDS